MINGQPVTQPIGVAPAPLPTAVQVGQAELPDGTSAAILSFATPQGVSHFFIDLKGAEQTAKALLRVVSAGALTLAPPGAFGATNT